MYFLVLAICSLSFGVGGVLGGLWLRHGILNWDQVVLSLCLLFIPSLAILSAHFMLILTTEWLKVRYVPIDFALAFFACAAQLTTGLYIGKEIYF